jgi:hypothetical protein
MPSPIFVSAVSAPDAGPDAGTQTSLTLARLDERLRAERSSLADARVPLRENAKERIQLECSLKESRTFPVPASQREMWPLVWPVANTLPSGQNAAVIIPTRAIGSGTIL